MPTRVIVTTTVNMPTEAIKKFDALPDWHLVAIGDRKTPADFRLDRGIYVTPAEQEAYDRELSNAIGWDCIQRRNFGFLIARDLGAEVVATVDDDNVPYDSWGEDLLLGREVAVDLFRAYEHQLAFDPLCATNRPDLWHRGFPVQFVNDRHWQERLYGHVMTPDVQADLWDGDPDVDAIGRMTRHATDVRFECVSFTADRPMPFNSQNTFLRASVLKDYFMFPGIGRMDDIWAAYYLQATGARVVFNRPSVRQVRNPHDVTGDFMEEYFGYRDVVTLLKALAGNGPAALRDFVPPTAWRAFELYRRHFP